MSNLKISQLSAGAPAVGTDLLPIARSGANYSLKISDITTASVPSGLNIATAGTTSPSPAYGTSEAPSNVNTSVYVEDVNGDWHEQASVDTTTVLNSSSTPTATGWGPAGTLLLTRKIFMRDDKASTQNGSNAFLSIDHTAGINTDVTNYQNQALYIKMKNDVSVANPVFAMEAIQAELDINGAIQVGSGSSPDGEFTVFSGQIADAHVGAVTSPDLGVNVARLQYFIEDGSTGGWGSVNPACVRALVSNVATSGNMGSTEYTCVTAQYDDVSNSVIANSMRMAGTCIDVVPPAHYFDVSNTGLRIGAWDQTQPNSFSFQIVGGQSQIAGFLGLESFYPITAGTIVTHAGFETTGLLAASTPTPINSSVSVAGTPGSTTYTYHVVAVDVNGNGFDVSGPLTTTTGPASPNSGNFPFVEIITPLCGASRYDIYRTVGGATQGKIGSIIPSQAQYRSSVSAFASQTDLLEDIALAGDSSTVPTGNATGSIVAQGPIAAGQYTVANLPVGAEGQTAYATNGRKVGEGAGSGTGVPVYFSNSHWRVYSTDAQVQS
jgi:hypothetical protein